MDSTLPLYKLPAKYLYLLLLIAGALLVFSFAPYSWHWSLPLVLLVVLYQGIQHLTPKQGLYAGWWFGLGYFGLSVSWVYNSIYMFGAATAPLAAAVTALFVLVMTVFPALTVWAYLRLRDNVRWQFKALLFASLWVLAELARGKIMGGFPWALIGYSQTTEPLGALAPWVGVYGIGFVMLFLPNVLIDAVRYSKHRGSGRATVGVLFVALATYLGLIALEKVPYSEAKGTSLRVRLVQANIPQELKFSRERLESSLQQYVALSMQDLPETDLIIWPETAIPTYFANVESVLEPFAQRLHDRGVEVLAGGFHQEGDNAFNSLRQLAGEKALYSKRHLVPFGEYMPFRSMLDWLAAYIEIPMSDLGRGTGPNLPMMLKGEPIGLSICYEDVFGEEMREVIPAASLLVNVSNDAWFGERVAPFQHQQKAQMRARELGRPLIRVTNTGVSSVIDYKGNIQSSIAQSTKGFLDATVYPRTGTSLYAQTGNWPVFILALLSAMVALISSVKSSRGRKD